jgi:hypothetical protein
MNREMNIQVNFHEYLPKNIKIQMNMNLIFFNSSWTEYSKISKTQFKLNRFESIRMKRNSGESASKQGTQSLKKKKKEIAHDLQK